MTSTKSFVNSFFKTNSSSGKETTKVSTLIEPTSNDQISFLDEFKYNHLCNISNSEFQKGSYHCFWCRHSFVNKPVFCPVRYYCKKVNNEYFSYINRSNCVLRENVPMYSNTDSNVIEDSFYYETDGVFCSFNCCQAWINDNSHIPLYDKSSILLIKMYKQLTGHNITMITPAHHWRLLKEYGGHLGIEQYRSSFNSTSYKEHGTSTTETRIRNISYLNEESLNF